MLGSSLNQSADGGSNINQAGRDNNIINYYSLPTIEFYEDDIKDIILIFSDSITEYADSLFPEFKGIEIDKKNTLNKLSSEYNTFIKDHSFSYFGKINGFLNNPSNSEYLEMYTSTTIELQQFFLSNRGKVRSFDEFFSIFFDYVLKKQRCDRKLMRNRTKVLIFFHFMYYNCDIGLKSV